MRTMINEDGKPFLGQIAEAVFRREDEVITAAGVWEKGGTIS